jgi:hypothetical protein
MVAELIPGLGSQQGVWRFVLFGQNQRASVELRTRLQAALGGKALGETDWAGATRGMVGQADKTSHSRSGSRWALRVLQLPQLTSHHWCHVYVTCCVALWLGGYETSQATGRPAR